MANIESINKSDVDSFRELSKFLKRNYQVHISQKLMEIFNLDYTGD